MEYLSVFLGCGAGGIARYALTRFASEHFAAGVPPGTLAVNLLGSFLIGFCFALFNGAAVPPPVRLLVTTGFLGGFTTFSTYAMETVSLFGKREIVRGLANILLHNALGLAAVLLGFLAFAGARYLAKGGPHA